MWPTYARSKGGKVSGKINREAAIKKYYDNPTICLNCGKVIRVKDNQKIADVKKKKFCNSSCAAKYNNYIFKKRIAVSSIRCEKCGDIVYLKKSSSGGYYKRKYCDKCSVKRSRCSVIGCRTKGDVFSESKNWTSARSMISKNARRVYYESRKEYKCFVCGYDIHVDICHIRPVSDFDDSDFIEDINDKNNLIALCLNHHWEYDHGVLDLNDISTSTAS